MKTLIGFLNVIAVEMKAVNLFTPYPAHSRRNCCPQSPSNSGFKSQITKTTQGVNSCLGVLVAIARLGGYLEHRCKTPSNWHPGNVARLVKIA